MVSKYVGTIKAWNICRYFSASLGFALAQGLGSVLILAVMNWYIESPYPRIFDVNEITKNIYDIVYYYDFYTLSSPLADALTSAFPKIYIFHYICSFSKNMHELIYDFISCRIEIFNYLDR